ncbi:MAG TPA: hypothetical protein VEW28_05325 [Candidatus Kapabacteria bacterium]|nr:hypothetical protein [Candidatus Kapabacteria bacterium]
MKFFRASFGIFIVFAFASCVTVHTPEITQLLNDLKTIKLDSLTRAMGSGAVSGVKDSLLDPNTKQKLDSLVGSLASTLVASAQDTLLNAKTRAKIDSTLSGIVSTITGKKTQVSVDSLITALGASARQQIGLILKDINTNVGDLLHDQLLGDSTKMLIDSLREHLAGSLLARDLHIILDTLNQNLNKTEKGVQQTSSTLIWSLVGGIVIICGFATWMFIVRRRYQKIAEVMSNEIHYIPDQKAYDDLTQRISREAKKEKVEPHLRKMLQDQGLLGDSKWTPPTQPQ